MKGLVHSNDPRLELLDPLLPPPKKAPVVELPQVPRVHVRQFAMVPLAHGPAVVDGPLQPRRPSPTCPHAILIDFNTIKDLLAAGVEGLQRHKLSREVLLPMGHGLWRERRLIPFICGGGRTRRGRCALLSARTRQPPGQPRPVLGQRLSDAHVHRRAQQLSAKASNRPFAVSPVNPKCGAQLLASRSARLGILQLIK